MVSGDSYLISQRESSSWYNLFQSSWTLNKKSDQVIYVHSLYLQLLCVTLGRTLQQYLDKKGCVFHKKKVNRSFTHCWQDFKCIYIKAVDGGRSVQFILDNTLFWHLVVYIFLVWRLMLDALKVLQSSSSF